MHLKRLMQQFGNVSDVSELMHLLQARHMQPNIKHYLLLCA